MPEAEGHVLGIRRLRLGAQGRESGVRRGEAVHSHHRPGRRPADALRELRDNAEEREDP